MRRARHPFVAALAFAAALASLAAPAAAATPWYHVEVMIFAQHGDSLWERNDWREEGPPPLAENAVELLARLAPADRVVGSTRRHAFRMLPASSLDLETTAERLDRSSEHRILLHVAWQQPGFRYDDAPAVHLSTLRGLVPDDRFTDVPGEDVDGTVRLWRRRFLHVETDLAFGDVEAWRERERVGGAAEASGSGTAQEEAAETAGEEALARAGRDDRLRVVRLTRNLRLRAGRLHYIDHPLFGMLLMVKRLR